MKLIAVFPRPFQRRVALILVAAGFAAAHAGSPPAARAVSSTIVISEFRTRGPSGGNDEFIELYNVTSSTLNIGGWKIRGSSSTGTISDRATIPANTMLGPGCHYLLVNTNTSGYSGVVTGNQTYSTGIADNGGLAVTLADNTIVDAAGMATGSAFKEGAILAQTTINKEQSYERKPGGTSGNATDTDDNNSDFFYNDGTSNPQNTSSTCVGSNVPTNPSGVGSVSPSLVQQGETALFEVAVTPGDNPTSTGLTVSVDMSPIMGANPQTFYDDGSNGDETAGDNVFSYQAAVSALNPPGTYLLPFDIDDAQARSGSGTITVVIVGTITPIHDVQGSGNLSPLVGNQVVVEGIVTAVKSNGFFVQEEDADADADPGTSEGLFVFTSGAPTSAATKGNRVRVRGTVTEFIPSADPYSPSFTELTAPAYGVSAATVQPLPTAVALEIPDPGGSLTQLEEFEGMRVTTPELTAVSPTQGSVNETNATSTSNGVFYAVISGFRPYREAGIAQSDALPGGAPCCVPRFDENPERIRVDSDGQVGVAAANVATGATFTTTGVLDFGFRTYTVLPDAALALTSTGMVAGAATVPTSNQYSVASMNLHRFFDVDNDPDIGEPVLSPTAFNNRLAKLSRAIRDYLHYPDVIGVQEVENLATLQAVASRVNADAVAASDPDPGYVAYLVEGNDVGGIDVGFLAKNTVSGVTVTQYGAAAEYTNPLTGLPETLNDRPPLVLKGTIAQAGGPDQAVTVVVNHLRSLGGIDDDWDTDQQGPRVRAKRNAQAEFLADLLQTLQLEDVARPVISVGDYNAFEVNDGYVDVMGTVIGDPTPASEVVVAGDDLVNPNLTDLVLSYGIENAYSYVFDGSAQALDHVVVNNAGLAALATYEVARVNADFPEAHRNDPARVERLSDHDYPVATFNFPVPTISVGDVTVTEGDSGTVNAAIQVTLSEAASSSVSFNYATQDGTATTADGDYASTSGTVTLTAGQVSTVINVPVSGDTQDEDDETFTLELSGATGATLADGVGAATITDDDPTPTIAVAGLTFSEGASAPAAFTLTLSAVSGRAITGVLQPVAGTAGLWGDFSGDPVAFTINAGQTSAQVVVQPNDDTIDEPAETFTAELQSLVNATAGTIGNATIVDNDLGRSFNVDYKADLLWTRGGQGSLWYMDGATRLGAGGLVVALRAREVVEAAADFNHDDRMDVLLRDRMSGAMRIAYLSGGKRLGEATVSARQGGAYRLAAVADFDEDSDPDLVWQRGDGTIVTWEMNGAIRVAVHSVGTSTDRVVGAGQFDGQGPADLVFADDAGNQLVFRHMTSFTVSGNVETIDRSILSADWTVEAVADYSGDGYADLVWRNGATGELTLWVFNQDNTVAFDAVIPGGLDSTWDLVGPR